MTGPGGAHLDRPAGGDGAQAASTAAASPQRPTPPGTTPQGAGRRAPVGADDGRLGWPGEPADGTGLGWPGDLP